MISPSSGESQRHGELPTQSYRVPVALRQQQDLSGKLLARRVLANMIGDLESEGTCTP